MLIRSLFMDLLGVDDAVARLDNGLLGLVQDGSLEGVASFLGSARPLLALSRRIVSSLLVSSDERLKGADELFKATLDCSRGEVGFEGFC